MPAVHYELKAFALVPLYWVFGWSFPLFSDGVEYGTPDKNSLSKAGWFMFVVVAVLTAIGFFWFNQHFSALGYS